MSSEGLLNYVLAGEWGFIGLIWIESPVEVVVVPLWTLSEPVTTLVVAKLDRLGRTTRDVLNLCMSASKRERTSKCWSPRSTRGPMGKMVLTILGMVAKMELDFIYDRQRAGIETAKARGVYKGRASHS